MNEINHLHFKQMAQQSADGLLDAGQYQQLEAHLAECAGCRAYAAEIEALGENLRSMLHTRWDMSSGRMTRSIPAISAITRRKNLTRRIFNETALTAFFAILLAASILLFERFAPPIGEARMGGEATASVMSRPTSTETSEPTSTVTSESAPTAMSRSTPTEVSGPTGDSTPSGRIVFQLDPGSGSSEIYLMNADGGGLINLSDNPAEDYAPVWSPDGRRIAYISEREGTTGAIYVVHADGSGLLKLALPDMSVGGFATPMTWSPDGRYLVVSHPAHETARGIDSSLFLFNTDGSGFTQLTDGSDNSPSWSPDGQWIAFIRRTVLNENQIYQVFLVNSDGTGLRQLTFAPEINSDRPVWSPDSQRMAYFSVELVDGKHTLSLKVVSVDGSAPVKLADLGEINLDDSGVFMSLGGLAWSPDGTRLAYVLPSGAVDHVVVAQADGSGVVTLAGPYDSAASLSWSPDGKWLVYRGTQAGQNDIYTLDTTQAATAPVKLLHHGQSVAPQWQPAVPPQDTSELPSGRMAFMDFSREGGWDVFSSNLNGSDRINLTNKPLNIGQGLSVLSPDGRQVAFSTHINGTWDILVVGSDGSGMTTIIKGDTTGSEWNILPGAWSPDGTRLAVIHNILGTTNAVVNQELALVNPDGSGLTSIRVGYLHNVRWSPDGSQIAFMSGVLAMGMDSRDDLWVINADGSGEIRVGTGLAVTETDQVYAWTPDSSAIAYIRTNLTPESRPEDSGRYEVVRVMVASGEEQVLTVLKECPGSERYWFGGLAWAPDGQRLAFIANHEGFNGLYQIDSSTIVTLLYQLPDTPTVEVQSEGGTPAPLPAYPKNSWDWGWQPAWSADGEWLFFSSGALTGQPLIYAIYLPVDQSPRHNPPVQVGTGARLDLGR
jgi:Tol biopolymer transport system component